MMRHMHTLNALKQHSKTSWAQVLSLLKYTSSCGVPMTWVGWGRGLYFDRLNALIRASLRRKLLTDATAQHSTTQHSTAAVA